MNTSPPPPNHHHDPLTFPEGFLWGAATSAHQVEGNNVNNDWWSFEQHLPVPMRSGMAADQYHRFTEDFALAKKFHHNTHRLSLEWSRIEPRPGEFDTNAIEHYRNVLQTLKEQGFVVMLTLWHFTLPQWVADGGGWENKKTVDYYIRFIERVIPEYKQYVSLWITLNEPGLYTGQAYLNGVFPPRKKSYFHAILATRNLAAAHKRAYATIHKLVHNAKVGMAQNTVSFRTLQNHSIPQHILVWFYDMMVNHLFYMLTNIKTHDFLGINYYFHMRVSTRQVLKSKGGFLPRTLDVSVTRKDVSDLGWEIHPDGMFAILEDMADYNKPIYITENGIASTNDDRRCRFLISYLKEIYHAIVTGVDIRGYYHWSLIDNFEWEHGYDPRFGLIEVDYKTMKRTPRNSAAVYADIIKHNGITHDMLQFIGHSIDAIDVLRGHSKLFAKDRDHHKR